MSNRKYFFNERYFEEIDAPEKAYWLGFITADGSISRKPYTLRIGLKESDKPHLEKFAKSINYNGEVKNIIRTNSVLLDLNSTQLVKDLARLGILPNKSLTVKPWTGPVELLPHYWRGVFDGDGCITKCTRARYKNAAPNTEWSVALCGSKDMVRGFRDFILLNTGQKGCNDKNGMKYSGVKYSGVEPPKQVLDILYIGFPSLDRKQKLYQELILREKRPTGLPSKLPSSEVLYSLHKKLKNWYNVADYLGVNRATIFSKIRRDKEYATF